MQSADANTILGSLDIRIENFRKFTLNSIINHLKTLREWGDYHHLPTINLIYLRNDLRITWG